MRKTTSCNERIPARTVIVRPLRKRHRKMNMLTESDTSEVRKITDELAETSRALVELLAARFPSRHRLRRIEFLPLTREPQVVVG